MALITLADAKKYLRVSTSGTEFDDLITFLIDEASDWVEEYCSRKFEAADYNEIYDGQGGDSLFLYQYPVIGPASDETRIVIWIDDEAVAEELIGQIDDDSVFIKDRRIPKGQQNIQIKYRAGYEIIPPTLRGAVGRLVAYLYQLDANRDIGRVSKTKGDETTSLVTDIPNQVKSALSTYRRLDFAETQKPLRVT